MTEKEFLNKLAPGTPDILDLFLRLLEKTATEYCVIGGLAVNAYVEPVVSLDLDIVVVANKIDALVQAAADAGLKCERFAHSVNIRATRSDLRIQIQTDARYQEFIPRAELKAILGYQMQVAALEDVITGKLWAYLDQNRRKSKRQKDLADLTRLVESFPEMAELLPAKVRSLVV